MLFMRQIYLWDVKIQLIFRLFGRPGPPSSLLSFRDDGCSVIGGGVGVIGCGVVSQSSGLYLRNELELLVRCGRLLRRGRLSTRQLPERCRVWSKT